MDWGCATGRTLRHFAVEAGANEFWGTDQDEASVTWAKENLSPPFRFVTCTAYPHLPFSDSKFGLIYGLSVFTHLEYLQDLWLMEIHRVLRSGGHAIFTVHDEHTVRFMAERGRAHDSAGSRPRGDRSARDHYRSWRPLVRNLHVHDGRVHQA
jgi:SAM-dependent methyltransferase